MDNSPSAQRAPKIQDRDWNTSLILFLIALRLINALSIRTFFQPDEYFQSLEPAWDWAFGATSGAWMTWEWREQLRSSVHPLLFTGVYKAAHMINNILEVTPSARAEILIAAPKVLQALFAAATDFFTYNIACQMSPNDDARPLAALILSVVNPWQWFCSVRTFSNSLETTFTIMAISYWPWPWFLDPKTVSGPVKALSGAARSNVLAANKASKGLGIAVPLAALACVLRPTNFIIWATISLTLIWEYSNVYQVMVLWQACISYGFAVLATTLSIDAAYYDAFVFPPFKFLHFNVVRSLAVFYGKNRIDYYLTEGLPLLLTTILPFASVALWRRASLPNEPAQQTRTAKFMQVLVITIGVSVLVLSTISHKEVRFIYPLLPLLHLLASEPLTAFWRASSRSVISWRKFLLFVALGLNVFIAYYVAYVHQRGVVDVIHYLRHEHEAVTIVNASSIVTSPSTSVGFLMPCHSTPWRSHLVHADIAAWALTCEPPLQLFREERQSYLDEADVFYADPVTWLEKNMEERKTIGTNAGIWRVEEDILKRSWPQYLVFFEQLEPTIQSVLDKTRYKECWRGFNTHWHDDWRRQGDVVVWCWKT